MAVAPINSNYHKQIKFRYQIYLLISFITLDISISKASNVTSPSSEFILVDGFQPAIITPPKDLRKDQFPTKFKFGASTSALQTEGSGTEGGRGPSTWDFMIEASKGNNAVDSYNLYLEDVKLLKDMGMNAYRFSMAWPRILPQGTEKDGPINQEGINFYNKLIDALIAEGIEPVVTLFHFDLPVALQNKYHGFLNSQIVEDFRKYADICFANFGDRVRMWSTINEPFVYGSFGFKMGLPDQLKNDPHAPYVASHNIILAHATVAQHYHDNYQKSQRGKIGISLPSMWYEPYSLDPKDVNAAKTKLDFMLGWFMDPFVNGDYPESMKATIRNLPQFTMQQKKMVKKACDYIGINYYTARFSKQNSTVDSQNGKIIVEYLEDTVDINKRKIGKQSQGIASIYVYPDGLRKLLLYIREKYGDLEIYVTENGYPQKYGFTASVKDSIQQGINITNLKAAFFDDDRLDHAEKHLIAVRGAINQGVDVKGYFVWSLMDNLEVGAGYDVRYGLNFVDYHDNHKRYPKKSAKWFGVFLREAP